jgi:UDP-2,3-diacylglucosamine pyrophosphatase LpxH
MAETASATVCRRAERLDRELPLAQLPVPAAPVPLATSCTAPGFDDTLIVSDLHLGLPDSRPLELLDLLHDRPFGRLLLLGDILHDRSFRYLDNGALQLLRHLRTIGTGSRQQLVWLHGNHDRQLGRALSGLLGVEGRESFVWTEQGRRCIALHGDCFDAFISRNVRFAQLCSDLFAFGQRCFAPYHGWLSTLEAWHTRIARIGDQVAERAMTHAAGAAFDLVVCGHTHEPMIKQATSGGRPVTYANSGAWIGRPASFLTVGPSGLALAYCH